MKIEFDEGYSFGIGLFETMKVRNGEVLFFEKHQKRLQKGLKFFGIDTELHIEEIQKYLQKQKIKNSALKVLCSEKNKLFLTQDDPYADYDKSRGLQVKLSSVQKHSSSLLLQYKTLCYFENIFEKRLATKEGYDEVLFLNEKRNVTEGAVSNIFFIRGDRLYTPKKEDGLLEGTMREYLLEKYEVEEISISEKDLEKFESCFLCNSLMGVLWIKKIGSIKYKKSRIWGKIRKDLQTFGF